MVGGRTPKNLQKVEEISVNLAEETFTKLEERAKNNGRTVEQEALEILRIYLIKEKHENME